jgi:Ca2+:H+ antiporter
MDFVFLICYCHNRYFSAGVLPLAYIIGLLFTFRTHSHIFEDVGTKGGQQKANGSNKKIVNNAEEDDESQAPEWSIPFSCIFMLISTLLYALIAENIVHELEDTISALKIHQAFLGLTFIALVPAITQIINAIKFALHDQIALSVQIGSASAIQISLIQIPVLIVMSAIINHGFAVVRHEIPAPLCRD